MLLTDWQQKQLKMQSDGLSLPLNILEGKGTYILVLNLDKETVISVGRLGNLKFDKGYYAYAGSAFGSGGLKSRIKHHLISPKKRLYWHIDYLREAAELKQVWVSDHGERLEHEWASALGNIASAKMIQDFGCSDCKCQSHLFHFRTLEFMQVFHNQMWGKGYEIMMFSHSSLYDHILNKYSEET